MITGRSASGRGDRVAALYGLMPLTGILVIAVGIILFAALAQDSVKSVFASSPSYAQLEARDEPFDWIDMTNNQKRDFNGNPSTDILAVNYHSNGSRLFSTLWLLTPFNESAPGNQIQLNYGMFIDADWNVNTGVSGVDYQVEISGRNETWTKTFSQWSSVDSNRTLYKEHNYLSLFDYPEGGKYLLLDADLEAMGAPSKYRVIFYAEQLNGSSWKTDFTNWINIPRPEIVVSTTPSSVDLLPGENKTIELQVKSSADFDSDIDISAMQNPDVQTKFINKRLHVPSDGIAAMPVQIKVSEDALPRQYTIPIIMNSSVPVESFVKPNYADAIDKTSVVPSFIDSEVITKQTSLTITVLVPMNQIDKFLESMKKLEFIITFSFGIVSGHIGPWIFAWVKKKKSRSTTNTENDNIIQAAAGSLRLQKSGPIEKQMAERNKN